MESLRVHAEGPPNETCDLYQQNIFISGQPFWRALKDARAHSEAMGVTVSVTDSDPSDDYELLDDEIEDFSDRSFSIRIVKIPDSEELKFFSIDGFERALVAEPNRFEFVSKVVVAEIDFQCSSAGLIVGPWLDESVAVASKSDNPTSPRRLVNDMSGKGLVPTAVGTWIADDASTWLRERFAGVASHRLSLCLPDAVSIDPEGNTIAHLRSGRKVLARVGLTSSWNDAALLAILEEVCRWVYLEGRDSETRHSLLSAELVRLWQSDLGWQDGLRECLDGAFAAAKMAYRLHVQSKGVDAFKLMSDLRKGLADDVRSLANSTSSLSSGLWRDAAVAFGVIAVRLASSTVGNWLLWMAAAYLLASCIFSCVAASNAVNAIVENEKSFRSRLYGPLLLDKEYDELAGKHYRKAESSFRWYRRFIVFAYLVAIAVLVGIARYGLMPADNFFHFVSVSR